MKLDSFVLGAGAPPQTATALDSANTLVVAFCGRSLDQAPHRLRTLRESFPRAVLMGASTSGEIHAGRIEDDTVTVAVLQLEHSSLRRAEARITNATSAEAGAALGRALAGDDLAGVYVLSSGLDVNGSALVRGLAGELPAGVAMAGGLAGDGDRFVQTWILGADAAPVAGRVAAVAFYGKHMRVLTGSRAGWDDFGPERRITRSDGNVLYELDGLPALELYKRYLGERAAGLPATGLLFPLLVRETQGESPVVRTILQVDEATQSLTFAGDLPNGGFAKLMRANLERLIDGAGGAVPAAPLSTPALSLAVSCVGRRLVLGERVEEELEAVMLSLPRGSHQVGFYSYGEIGPQAPGNSVGPCALHNQTMTITLLQECTP